MNPIQTAEGVLKHRLPIFCSTCTRATPDADVVCRSLQCGSPLARRDFIDYKGPLPKTAWSEWCFVCGNGADVAVQVHGSRRKFGMCQQHLPWLVQMRPVGGDTSKGVEVHTGRGVLSLAQLFPKTKTLHDTLIAADAYMDEQEARGR